MKTINVINELDKLMVHYFNKIQPFEIANNDVTTIFSRGTPDNLSISEILSNVGDIKFPILVINRDDNFFSLQKEKNIPSTEGTRIIINRIAKDKYINSDESNVNVETYMYNPPIYFNSTYRIIFYCEYLKHSTEFITQFLDRLNQSYIHIQSEKFQSIYFDVVWLMKDNISTSDNYSETTDSKRLLKVEIVLDGNGYYISEASQKIEREVSKTILKGFLS